MRKFKRSSFYPFWITLWIFVLAAGALSAATLNCPTSTTLEELFDCIKLQMPHRDEGYTKPTAQQFSDLDLVMGQMLAAQSSITLPASLTGIMEYKTFTDSGNGRTYRVLMEVEDADSDGLVDRGFGTFIVYDNAERELNIAAPHPAYDLTTGYEAIRIFKYTSSRSFLMAGTHRYASSTTSSCQSSYAISDAAHNNDCMFFAGTQALIDYYGGNTWHQIQYHGLGADSCSSTDVFISHGEYQDTPPAGDIVYVFQSNMKVYNSTWLVVIDGGSCTYDGGSNTSGRLINGIPANQVCNTAPSSPRAETFIHIEQKSAFRTASDWIDAVNATFGPGGGFLPPNAPVNVTIKKGKRKLTLNWSDGGGAESFNIYRSFTSGGPYSLLTSGVTNTSYVDGNLQSGTMYYYVITAVNAGGESAYSAEVGESPR